MKLLKTKREPQQEVPEKSGPDLERRIRAARADADAYIDALAAKIKERDAPGIPLGVVKQMLTQNSGCSCAVALKLIKDPNYAA